MPSYTHDNIEERRSLNASAVVPVVNNDRYGPTVDLGNSSVGRMIEAHYGETKVPYFVPGNQPVGNEGVQFNQAFRILGKGMREVKENSELESVAVGFADTVRAAKRNGR
jgi:hypothetical protein